MTAAGDYYRGLNLPLLQMVPLTARRVLEVGCSEGRLGEAYLRRNPTARYLGIEIVEAAAGVAAGRLDQVITGDIGSAAVLAALDAWRDGEPLDAIVLGDVLEHLVDPWAVLKTLADRLAPGGVAAICVPNVAHWSLIVQQLRGRWDYAEQGLLDRTHLRFFTRQTAVGMVEAAGLALVEATSQVTEPDHSRTVVAALKPVLRLLETTEAEATENLAAFQWRLRAVKGAVPDRLTVAAVGQPPRAGLTEARVDHPLQALASLPDTRVAWGAGTVQVPAGAQPGILLLHRQPLHDPGLRANLQRMAAAGWILVLDWDDDPRAQPLLVETDFLCFRFVHAVSVSSEALADLARQWNPEVKVLSNAVPSVVRPPAGLRRPPQLRVFFGALDRGADWAAVEPGIVEAGRALGGAVSFVFAHDRAVFDGFPLPDKEFHPTLPAEDYLALLETCDIALMPLLDSPSARLKSDLKLVEAASRGALPICSPLVYGARAEHHDIALFAETPEDWRRQLLAACTDARMREERQARGLDYVARCRLQAHAIGERLDWYRALRAAQADLETARRRAAPG